MGWHRGHCQQCQHVQTGRQRAQNVQRELPELIFTELPEMAHQFLQIIVHARHFFLPFQSWKQLVFYYLFVYFFIVTIFVLQIETIFVDSSLDILVVFEYRIS